MNYRVVMTAMAKISLRDIRKYISLHFGNPSAAKRFYDKTMKRIRDLGSNPHMYRAYEDEPYKSRGIRYFPVDNYIVYYRVDDQAQMVYILKISHGMQSPDTQLHGI